MDCSTPGFPVLHYLPELAQAHVHWISDAIQSSRPLSSPSPPVIIITSYILLYYKSISPSHACCRHSVNAAVFIFIDIIHIPWNSSSFNCRILAKSTASCFSVWPTTGIWGAHLEGSYPGWVTSPTGRTWDKWTLEWKGAYSSLFPKATFWPCEKKESETYSVWNGLI